MAKYKNIYRIPSSRAEWWDYGRNGVYSITICTKNKKKYFGTIKNGVMHLSKLGVIADVFWYEIKSHSKNIQLGAYTVMPNHIHGILILYVSHSNNVTTDEDINEIVPTKENINVETRHALSLPPMMQSTPLSPLSSTNSIASKRFQNQGKNTISSIIGGYKAVITKHANRLGYTFGWQSRFHDRIIRDEDEYRRVSEYIINNPANWEKDTLYR